MADADATLTALASGTSPKLAALTRPSYTIAQQTVVNGMLPQMQATNIGQTITDMSSYANRYYTTTNGANAAGWLKNKWTTMTSGRSDIKVEAFTHSWKQTSVILTTTGTDAPSEIVVMGAHLDSINGSGTTESTIAPGADDDASGIASLTEVIRVLVAGNYKPKRTLKFIGYSAEEVGLKGSADIAAQHATQGANVVGVMQLDMTNYQGSANDIYLFSDYTDSAQNTFLANVIATYLPTLKVGTDRCGYACSDHASWNAQGYAASMPFESSFAADNPNIHSANDTYANMGSQADHALKFARKIPVALKVPALHSRAPAAVALVEAVPRLCEGWALLGDRTPDGVDAYAAYRVGYHRGLDLLRGNGWKGSGYVRWVHPTNRGFLRCLIALHRAAGAFGEADEVTRIDAFLVDCDPTLAR